MSKSKVPYISNINSINKDNQIYRNHTNHNTNTGQVNFIPTDRNNTISDSDIKKKEHTLFKSLKDKTHPFFKNSVINSCQFITMKNGNPLAISYNTKPTLKINKSPGNRNYNNAYSPQKTSIIKTTYQNDYNIKSISHVGMKKKPLEIYNPNAYRSRLPIADYHPTYKNKSSIEIGDLKDIFRKQWVSTYKDTYDTPEYVPISNTGILAEISKRKHRKIADI